MPELNIEQNESEFEEIDQNTTLVVTKIKGRVYKLRIVGFTDRAISNIYKTKEHVEELITGLKKNQPSIENEADLVE